MFEMNSYLLLVVTLLAMAMPSDAASQDSQETLLSASLLSFGSRFFEAAKSNNQNVILSPISLHSALGMLHLGSKESSKTQTELNDVMGLEKLSNIDSVHSLYAETIKKFNVITAEARKQTKIRGELEAKTSGKDASLDFDVLDRINSNTHPTIDIWTMVVAGQMMDVNPDYVKNLQQSYLTRIEAPKNDIEKRKLINETKQWAKEAGFGDDIISDDDVSSKPEEMTLLSAINVAAFWLDKFDEYKRPDGFFNFGDPTKPATEANILSQIMFHGGFVEFAANPSRHTRQAARQSKNYSRLASLNFRAISLPLHGNVSLDIFEPLSNGTGHDLADLEAKLLAGDGSLEQTLEILDMNSNHQQFERISMPAFKFESSIDARQALKSLGLEQIFSKKAELYKMSSRPLFVGKASHKAVIEVEKGGIKAAALTTFKAYPMSLNLDPLNVDIKNPYFFLVRHQLAPLFMGHLVHL